MAKKLSIFRGRTLFKFYNGVVRTTSRRNPSLKLGPRNPNKTSLSSRRKFFSSRANIRSTPNHG